MNRRPPLILEGRARLPGDPAVDAALAQAVRDAADACAKVIDRATEAGLEVEVSFALAHAIEMPAAHPGGASIGRFETSATVRVARPL